MNRWMQIAYDEALNGMLSEEGGPFGAVIVKDGKIVAKSHNRVLISKDPTAHAEINVIREASSFLDTYNLSECELYTTCMPCPMCLGAILWARISKVYYGATAEDAARGGFDDSRFYEVLQHKSDAVSLMQIDANANAKLFNKWNEKENHTVY